MINGCIFCICVFALLYFLGIMTGAGAMMSWCIFLYLCIKDELDVLKYLYCICLVF